jgi:hypothetical protein
MLRLVYPEYVGEWVSPTSIADALTTYEGPIEAVQYLSEQILAEARATAADNEKKRKGGGLPAQPPAKKAITAAPLPPDAFLGEFCRFEAAVLQRIVDVAAADVVDAIRRNDSGAWGKFAGSTELFNPQPQGAGGPKDARLGPWMALLAICLWLAVIFGDLVHGEAGGASTSSPQAKAAGRAGTGRSTDPPAGPAPKLVARPRTKDELQAIIDTLVVGTGTFTLGGKAVSVLPHSNREWEAVALSAVPPKDSLLPEVFRAVGQACAPGQGAKLTRENETAATRLRASLVASATPVRIALHLFTRAYCHNEITVGGKPISELDTLLTATRIAAMTSDGCPKPPVLVFLTRTVTRLRDNKKHITAPFWEWVKANTMAVFEYVCVTHQHRRLELPRMYPTPAHPPCAGEVYHPRPPAPPRAPTPNRDHGRTGPGAKGYARRAGTRRD